MANDKVRSSHAVAAVRALLALAIVIAPSPANAGDPAKPLPASPAGIPAPPSGDRSFRFVVISDSNASYGSVPQGPGVKRAVEVIAKDLRPAFVIHAGDMVAGQKRGLTDDQLNAMWDGYHAAVTDPLAAAGIPLVPSPGNHDADPSFPDRAVYVSRWNEAKRVPKVKFTDRAKYPLYYSFEHEKSVFVMMDGAAPSVSADQRKWIAGRLAAASGADNRFAVSHIPLARVLDFDHGALAPKDDLLRILTEGRVNVFFSGHHHVYYKGRLGRLNTVATGIIGSGVRSLSGVKERQPLSFIVVDVVKGDLRSCFALKGPEFKQVFADAELPERVEEYVRNP